MDIKNLAKWVLTTFRIKLSLHRKWLIPFLLFFLPIFLLPKIVFADTIGNYSLNSSNTSLTYAYNPNYASISFSLSMNGFANDNTITVKDKNNNVIFVGSGGSIDMDNDVFPITFSCNSNQPFGWGMTLWLSGSSSNSYSDSINNSISDMNTNLGSKLDSILNKLDGLLVKKVDLTPIMEKIDSTNALIGVSNGHLLTILGKIQEIIDLLHNSINLQPIIDRLDKIIDLLDNKNRMEQGKQDLQNSVNDLKNYSPVSVQDTSINSLGNLNINTVGSMPNINVKFFGTTTVNVLDLSAVSPVLSTIKLLLSSIMWVSLFIYFLRYFMPQFKV